MANELKTCRAEQLRVGQSFIGPRLWHLKVEARHSTAYAVYLDCINRFGESKKIRLLRRKVVELLED